MIVALVIKYTSDLYERRCIWMVVVFIYRMCRDELAGFTITVIRFDTIVELSEP